MITAGEDHAGGRLDVFLSARLDTVSRSSVKALIKAGRVLFNGRPVKPSQEIRPGDRVEVWLPAEPQAEALIPEAMALDVLYEDEDLVVVNKGPGLVVHPGAGHACSTLVHGLLARCGRLASQGAPLRPGIVHRLDRDTSGAMVVARSDLAYLQLVRQFEDRRVKKEYLALVFGTPAHIRGEIRTQLGRHPVDRKRMAVLTGRGREAITFWTVERNWVEVSLLRLTIETGRTHQIRVHLSHLGHPVLGDATYGGGKRRIRSMKSNLQERLGDVPRQMLHAHRLAFEHPRTGRPLSFTAPPPDDFVSALRRLDAAAKPPVAPGATLMDS